MSQLSEVYAWGYVGTDVEGVNEEQVVDILRPSENDEDEFVIRLNDGTELVANCDEISILLCKSKMSVNYGDLKEGDEVYSYEFSDDEKTVIVSRRDGVTVTVPTKILSDIEVV